jgi:hypothetical protein
MSTELTKQSNQLASSEVPQEAWGAEGTRASDINIPRINLMQGLSDFVKKRSAQIGDLVDSMTGEVLAPFGKGGLELIPICMHSEWIVNEILPPQRQGDKPKEKFIRREPIGEDNEYMPFEDMENGKPIKRTKQLNFFVLSTKHLDQLPFLVSFRKTSLKAGRNLATYFRMCEMKGLPPAHKCHLLDSTEEARNGDTFQVFTVKPGRLTTKEELEVAYMWYQTLKKSTAKIVDAEPEESGINTSAQAASAEEVPF